MSLLTPTVNFEDTINYHGNDFNNNTIALQDNLRDALHTQLTPFNFGLISLNGISKPIQIKENDGAITIIYCQAITPGGARIDITQHNPCFLSKKNIDEVLMKLNDSSEAYIIIATDFSKREKAGEPNPSSPYYRPYIKFAYNIQIEKKLSGFEKFKHWVVVGKVVKSTTGKIELDKGYIPPCTTMSYPKLLDFLNLIQETEKAINEQAITINTIHSQQRKESISAKTFLNLVKEINRAFSLRKDEVELALAFLPPIYTFLYVRSIARSIYFYLGNCDRSIIEKIFKQKVGISGSKLFNILEDLFDMDYNHCDMEKVFEAMKIFLNETEQIMKRFGQSSALIFAEHRLPEVTDVQKENKKDWFIPILVGVIALAVITLLAIAFYF